MTVLGLIDLPSHSFFRWPGLIQQAGDVIVFNSAITHDGGMVESGRKYILRSEVMYSAI